MQIPSAKTIVHLKLDTWQLEKPSDDPVKTYQNNRNHFNKLWRQKKYVI